jgi:membrane dipeptidase
MRVANKLISGFCFSTVIVSIVGLLTGVTKLSADNLSRAKIPTQVSLKAQLLAKEFLIADTHIDVPFRLELSYEDVTQGTKRGQFDYPRAKMGGLNVPFMSIYIPSSKQRTREAGELANRLIDRVEAMVGRAPEKFSLAASVSEVYSNFDKGLITLAMGMENGAPIAGDINNLEHFYKRGVRYITLTHSKPNHISDSSYDEDRPWGGLSPFGRELVLQMNDIGMMVDVSHISDQAFWQVMDISKAPVIASHSSARFFTPEFERNMSDEMIVALAAQGGVVQINAGSAFLTEEAMLWNAEFKRARLRYEADSGSPLKGTTMREFSTRYFGKNPYPYANIEDVLDHIDRVVNLTRVDAVGIGSDFDGVGNTLPEGFKDVSQYVNLIEGLLIRGYNEQDIGKILGGNLMRVWSLVEAYSLTRKS